VTFFAASLKLSAHTLTTQLFRPTHKSFEGFKRYR